MIEATDKRQAKIPPLYAAAEEWKQENQGAREIFTTRVHPPPLLFPHRLLTPSGEDGGEAKPSPRGYVKIPSLIRRLRHVINLIKTPLILFLSPINML